MRSLPGRDLANPFMPLLCLGLASICLLSAQPNLTCIEELTIPKYPPLARQARLQGQVEVRVALKESGKVIKTISTSAAPLLRQAVERALDASRFSVSCPHHEFSIVFAFELDLDAPPKTPDEGTVVIRRTGTIVIRASTFPLSGSMRFLPKARPRGEAETQPTVVRRGLLPADPRVASPLSLGGQSCNQGTLRLGAARWRLCGGEGDLLSVWGTADTGHGCEQPDGVWDLPAGRGSSGVLWGVADQASAGVPTRQAGVLAPQRGYAMNRNYAPQWGRFTTLDPYQASAKVANPQSLNRHSCVENDR
jgi:TonB family protein